MLIRSVASLLGLSLVVLGGPYCDGQIREVNRLFMSDIGYASAQSICQPVYRIAYRR